MGEVGEAPNAEAQRKQRREGAFGRSGLQTAAGVCAGVCAGVGDSGRESWVMGGLCQPDKERPGNHSRLAELSKQVEKLLLFTPR